MNKYKDKIFSSGMFIIALTFYLFFAFYDGAVICVDSPSYINMESSREPLYPLLLQGFRILFSEGDYLFPVAVFQSMLAAVACYLLADYLWKNFVPLKITALAILVLPMAVSLLCRFAAKRASMYSNSILTEGITISLYMIFFRFLLEYYFKQSKRSLVACFILMFLQISIRKQMIIAVAMFVVVALFISIKNMKIRHGLITIVISFVVVFGCNFLLDTGYNYILHGENATHTGDIRFISTMAFYTAERNDGENIEDESIRELFYEIYDICDENGHLKHSANEGWNNRVAHFGDYYDCIQIDVMWPKITQFVIDEYGCEGIQISEHADDIMNIISKSVIPHNIDSVLQVFFDNFISGLIVTVAQRNRILNWYSLFIYIVYIGVLCINIKWIKDSKVIAIACFILVSVVFNVGLVSMVIFCQTRYTIYNMALFYISLIIMLDALLKTRKQILCKR